MSAPPRSPADVRIGIIGCGRAATSLHVPALRRVRGAAVVALSDCDEARLRHLALRCEGATGFADYHELLANGRVDLVAVCVPVAVHAPVALAAWRAGKHVFIEKPLALTLEDCDRLVEQAARSEASGIRSAVGFNLRSHRLVGQARDAIRSGRLGEVEMVRTLWTADWSGGGRPPWHAVRNLGGGALLEIGTHQADLWRYLLDSEVETIQALARSTAFDDQTAVFEARMTNGVLVSAAVSQRSAPHNMIEVYGERGSLRFSCYHADSMSLTATGRRETGPWRRLGPVLGRAAALPGALKAARQGGDFQASYVRQWERILAALAGGAPMPAAVHDGRQAARIVDAALRSSQERAAERAAEPAEAGG